MEKKSGKHWVQWANINACNSNSIMDLSPSFRINVLKFIDALVTAGATVEVVSTLRSPKRAYLFHWCWLIGLGKSKPSEAPKMDGVDIQWDHGDLQASIKGAKDMIVGFGLAVPEKSKVAPALRSNHIAGNAVDLKITCNSKIKVRKKDGKLLEVNCQVNPNSNMNLISVGRSYSVIKHTNDAPHWSVNGR